MKTELIAKRIQYNYYQVYLDGKGTGKYIHRTDVRNLPQNCTTLGVDLEYIFDNMTPEKKLVLDVVPALVFKYEGEAWRDY